VVLCPGALTTLYDELIKSENKYGVPCWLSPRFLPGGLDPVETEQFAEKFGISSDALGFVSNPPFTLPITLNGHSLDMFAVSRAGLVSLYQQVGLEPFKKEGDYAGSYYPNVERGLRVMFAGHKNLLSWNACVIHEQSAGCPNKPGGSEDAVRFVEKWGQEVYEKLEGGRIWTELWLAQEFRL